MLAKIAAQEQELKRRLQQRRGRKPTAVTPPLTPVELEMEAEERAEAAEKKAPTARQGPVLSNIPVWGDHRVKRYATEEARRAARVESQKRSQAKAKLNPTKATTRLEKQRVAKREWAAKSREKKRAAKAAFASAEVLSILQRFGLKHKYFLVLSLA